MNKDAEENKDFPKPSLFMAILPVALTLGLMAVQLLVFDAFIPHVPLAIGIAIVALLAWSQGYKWKNMEEGLFHVVYLGLQSIAILTIVGMIIGTWMLSGTVPVMIYYGLQVINPTFFLLAAMIICAIVSVSLGTSWGTMGTVGIALVGIGQGLGVPMPLTGGAIVSGAFFGDKMSPLSDTTNLAPAVTGTNLFKHIKNMMPTAVPAMLIAGVIYILLGLRFAGEPMVAENITQITGTLADTFTLHPLLLLPAVLVITLAILQFPAIPVLFVGVVAGGLVAVIGQGASVKEIFAVMQSGFQSSTGVETVDALLSKGGIQSMMWVISLLIIALGFGGILERTRCLEVILHSIVGFVKSRFGLVTSSTLSAFGTNIITGDPYLSIALPGRMFGPAYRGKNLSALNLSRSLEEGGTLMNPLVPWSAGGAFATGALGIETLAYAPFAFACWLSPIIGIIYAAFNKFMPAATQEEQVQWVEDEEYIMIGGQMIPGSEFDAKNFEKELDKKRKKIKARKKPSYAYAAASGN
ncbi:NhaC family Na+:H+ antiporter [Desulfosalsimonas propionicica]|uniref:NhaC family Na+:H+ antiporter n=1 Tax=Desulfosalsimonas propionicica TaxID=332175 RepID=A0A7W0CCH3_9BACT|nr:Na+/H+ antiporter NhaC [Desulfosalsimonas propionicica]MBA2883122.1 NhaC family Na+:H+ antiporter [Desulfosalsimonas propionicica]